MSEQDIQIAKQGDVRTSPEVGDLIAALAKAQGEFDEIKKEKTVDTGTFSYKYADLADVMDAVRKPLSKHNIAVNHLMVVEGGTIFLRTRLSHGNQWMESEYPVASYANNAHQKIGASLTYARRYSVCAILGIAAEEDMDADPDHSATADTPKPKQRRQTAERQPPAVVQGGEGQKPLPPTVGEKKAANGEFHYVDRHGERWADPLAEDAFVNAIIVEIKECAAAQAKEALGKLLADNSDEMQELSDSSQTTIQNAVQRANKQLRPDAAEPGPLV